MGKSVWPLLLPPLSNLFSSSRVRLTLEQREPRGTLEERTRWKGSLMKLRKGPTNNSLNQRCTSLNRGRGGGKRHLKEGNRIDSDCRSRNQFLAFEKGFIFPSDFSNLFQSMTNWTNKFIMTHFGLFQNLHGILGDTSHVKSHVVFQFFVQKD